MNEGRKNLIIISIDNLRADALTGFGLEKNWQKYHMADLYKTPNLSQLARSGKFFNNCWSTAPYTTNAHASMLTGFWPHQHGVIDFFSAVLQRPTILEILKQHDYVTLWQTDFDFLLGDKLGFARGIDKFFSSNEAESLAWLQTQKNNFAAFFHFADVHEPYGFADLKNSREEFAEHVFALLEKFKILPLTAVEAATYYPLAKNIKENDLLLKQNYRRVLQYLYEKKDFAAIMQLYRAGVERFDGGRFKDFWHNLQAAGLLENTLVVITGDHGEAWDDNNFGHNKGNGRDALSDELLRVPLLFWHKDFKSELVSTPVRSIDIVPSICSFLDITDYKFSGVNLLSEEISQDLPCYSQYWESDSALVTVFLNKNLTTEELQTPNFSSHLRAATLRQSAWLLSDYYPENGKAQSMLSHDSLAVKDLSLYNHEFLALRRALDESNRKTQITYDKIEKRLDDSDREAIAAQLRAIGYNI